LAPIQAARTAVFYLLFLGQTVVLAIIVGIIAIIWRRRTAVSWALAQYWRNSNVVMLRWIVGIRSHVEGGETIPPGPCIIAAKHQSDWDIFAILPYTDGKPAYIAKRELIDIPFFGWAAQSIDTISIDRKLGAKAIPAMLAEARKKISRGCRIVIYPEGTRKAPLAAPDYRQGIVRMYEALGVPVIPVALNSGLYWGRNSLVMWPGTARAKFLPAIMPGLPGPEFAERLKSVIEAETTRLIAQAVAEGVARPLDEEFRARLAAATQAAGAPQPN
jgi:1-acyl-sn-glycerol-3-phosphate acyltransferase